MEYVTFMLNWHVEIWVIFVLVLENFRFQYHFLILTFLCHSSKILSLKKFQRIGFFAYYIQK